MTTLLLCHTRIVLMWSCRAGHLIVLSRIQWLVLWRSIWLTWRLWFVVAQVPYTALYTSLTWAPYSIKLWYRINVAVLAIISPTIVARHMRSSTIHAGYYKTSNLSMIFNSARSSLIVMYRPCETFLLFGPFRFFFESWALPVCSCWSESCCCWFCDGGLSESGLIVDFGCRTSQKSNERQILFFPPKLRQRYFTGGVRRQISLFILARYKIQRPWYQSEFYSDFSIPSRYCSSNTFPRFVSY